MTAIESLDDITVSTVLDEWSLELAETTNGVHCTRENYVYWNPEETRSVKILEQTFENGNVQTDLELADISTETTDLLDNTRTVL